MLRTPLHRLGGLARQAARGRALATHTSDVREGMELDMAAVKASLAEHGVDASGATVSQFTHGQSNPTYLLDVPGSPQLVLRKQVSSRRPRWRVVVGGVAPWRRRAVASP